MVVPGGVCSLYAGTAAGYAPMRPLRVGPVLTIAHASAHVPALRRKYRPTLSLRSVGPTASQVSAYTLDSRAPVLTECMPRSADAIG
eukprot:2741270-Rhodomonas_salina.7